MSRYVELDPVVELHIKIHVLEKEVERLRDLIIVDGVIHEAQLLDRDEEINELRDALEQCLPFIPSRPPSMGVHVLEQKIRTLLEKKK